MYLLIALFGYFSLLISAAEISQQRESDAGMSIMRIIPEDASVPDYTPLGGIAKNKNKVQNSFKNYPFPSKSHLTRLPTDILTSSFSYLSFKDLANVSQTSKYLHDATEKSLEDLKAEYGDFDLSRLSRKDQMIVILHLLPLLKTAYPGLFRRKMTSADLICLSLLAFVASSNLKVVNKQLIMPTSQEFKNLFNIFSAMNYILNINNNIYNPVPTMLKSCGVLVAFLTLVIKSEQIPYTLETINALNRFATVNNSQFNSRSIVLHSLGVDMGVKDQRFINNLLKNMSTDQLISSTIGKRHALHEFIVKGLLFDEELFSKPELSEVPMDRETRSNFYEAALIYSIKYENWSCLKGLLIFANYNFPSFSISKLDLMRSEENYNEFFKNYYTIPLIAEFLIN